MRAVLVALALAIATAAGLPGVAVAKTCADYPNQAAAQRAADTRDADGDGIYCESLPCPCSKKKGGSPDKSGSKGCTKPSGVQNITFSKTKYPTIRRHFLRALREGWPRVLILHRRNADQRRDRALAGIPTKRGYDRDEYPPAVGREHWRADVAYVPSAENRSHGSVLGIKLRRFCRGTRFRYVFY